MATFAEFQEYRNACDNLSDLCRQMRENHELFTKMADSFQGWAELFEPNYWQVDNLEKLTAEIQHLAYLVQKAIELGQ